MISHISHCVFVHIPKCAGSSINQQLGLQSLGFSGHAPASYHIDYLKDYFSFTFVRDPYDRIASAYRYFQSLGVGHRWYKRNKIISDLASSLDFDGFIDHIPDFMKLMKREEGSFESGIHFQPFDYFIDEPLDFIGRFENIQEDYAYILARLGKRTQRLIKTNSTQSNYFTIYTRDSRLKVYYLYKEDFQKYQYSQ